MAEVQQHRSSGSRGRGSGRGGRGGYVPRGGRAKATGPGKENARSDESYEDQGEIGQLKKQYASQLTTIREMFPDWTSEDIVFALQETNGNLENTIDRISEGHVEQWGEVKKKSKDRARPKTKESSSEGFDSANRSARGRGDGTRGGRGRGSSERGRGSARGGRASHVNGTRKPPAAEATSTYAAPPEPDWGDSGAAAASTDATDSWADAPAPTDTASPGDSWEMVTPAEATPVAATPAAAPEAPKQSLRPDGTRSWASMLRPVAKPAPPKTKAPTPAEQALPAADSTAPELSAAIPELQTPDEQAGALAADEPNSVTSADLTPAKDPLTEHNLEQVEDSSKPIETATVASTTGGTTVDPRSGTASGTPLHGGGPQSTSTSARPSLGGYATTALKATAAAAGAPGAARTPSFQRRLKEQQEAVVMPGKHAVDRAAVQFGSMGLADGDAAAPVDDEREEAETRAQPPQHSPLAPRAALPPMAQTLADAHAAGAGGGPRPAPGLGQPHPAQAAQAEHAAAQHANASNYSYNQFNAPYGGAAGQAEAAAHQGKGGYEPFGQQAQQVQGGQQQPSYEAYAAHGQAPGQHAHAHAHAHAQHQSLADQYASYYSGEGQRHAYGGMYAGQYGQHQPHPHQQQQQPGTAAGPPHRAGSAFGSSGGDTPATSAPGQAQPQPQPTAGRYPSDAQNSGHTTPSIVPGGGAAAQHQPQQHAAHHSQSAAAAAAAQAQAQAQQHGAYPGYGSSPYGYGPYGYSQYMQHYAGAAAHAGHGHGGGGSAGHHAGGGHHHGGGGGGGGGGGHHQQTHAHQYGRERPAFDDVRRYDESFQAQAHQQQQQGGQQQQQQQQQQQVAQQQTGAGQQGASHHYGYGGAAGYGGPYGGGGAGGGAKYGGAAGGAQHGYGLSPGYGGAEHAASPATVGAAYGQQQQGPPGPLPHGARAGSTQPGADGGPPPQQQAQPGGHAGYGAMPDVFGRSHSGLGQQQQPGGPQQQQPGQPPQAGQQQQGGPGQQPGGLDDASKAPGGPSPAPGPGARPASAVNQPGGPQQQQAGGAQQGGPAAGHHGYGGGGYPQGTGAGAGGFGGLGAGGGGGQHGHYGAGFGGYHGGNSRGWSQYGH